MGILSHGARKTERAASIDFAPVVVIRLSRFAPDPHRVRTTDQRYLSDQDIDVEELAVRLRSIPNATEAGNTEARDAKSLGIPEKVLQTKQFAEVFPERAFLQEEVIRPSIPEAQFPHRIRAEGVRNAKRDVLVVHGCVASGIRQRNLSGLQTSEQVIPESNRSGRAEVMVDPINDLIVVAQIADRKKVVIAGRRIRLRKRVDVLDASGERHDTVSRDDIVRKWTSHIAGTVRVGGGCCRIEYRQIIPECRPAEVSAPLRRRRHARLAGAAIANAGALVSCEEEAPVAEDAPA